MSDITIIVPVFNAAEEVRQCVDSLLGSDGGSAPILLFDDGSAETAGQSLAERYEAYSNVSVLSHFRNRGYTRNINFGLNTVSTPYVAIVNSDTVVPSKWCEKAVGHLRDNPVLAGIGALSNAASYQSVPLVADRDGTFASNRGYGEDRAARERINTLLEGIFAGAYCDAPLLNGFFTTFRMQTLRQIGLFDDERFPQGYGEENDLCLRLLSRGYRLGIDLSTFVYHHKSASFGDLRKKQLSAQGGKRLAQLYGDGVLDTFTALLKDNDLLALARLVAARYRMNEPAEAPRALSGPAWESAGIGAVELGRVARIGGPARVLVSADGFISQAASPDELALSGGDGGVQIDLPQGCTLSMVGGDWLWSAAVSLAIASQSVPVHVRSTFSDAPEAFAAQVKAAEIPFRMLYLD